MSDDLQAYHCLLQSVCEAGPATVAKQQTPVAANHTSPSSAGDMCMT